MAPGSTRCGAISIVFGEFVKDGLRVGRLQTQPERRALSTASSWRRGKKGGPCRRNQRQRRAFDAPGIRSRGGWSRAAGHAIDE